MQTGCRITDIDSARRVAKIASIGTRPLVTVDKHTSNPPWQRVKQWISGRPAPSDRTLLYLRKNNLLSRYKQDPVSVVQWMCQECRAEPNMESVHAMAELSKLEADWSSQAYKPDQAVKYYAHAVIHAYQFLFDSKLNVQRNAYDPQFREICDIYNRSLESLLRLICKSDSLHAGESQFVGDQNLGVNLQVVVEGRWKKEEFERFELVNDYHVSGIDNSYRTYGLGVPLIAIRKPIPQFESRYEKYYPPALALPLTAFLEVLEFDPANNESYLTAVLRLYDPLERTVLRSETRSAPLESDLTVPLAYYLNDPLLNTDVLSTVSLLDATVAAEYFGLYMLEPFDENKIPVIMVHGLWSNPVTWLTMFNDLRAHPILREHYQFWFYMYPTGQPFWISADDLRQDLAELRRDIDPTNSSRALQQIVLVGHSMGGLVARMQTVNSRDDFWDIVGSEPIDHLTGDPQTLQNVRELFYFRPDPAIHRVITIATPHQGSSYANNITRWLSHQAFRLPKMLTTDFDRFVKDNKTLLRNTKHLTIPTSIDSLSPQSPFIHALFAAQTNPQVKYHNIYGNIPASRFLPKVRAREPSDGVVSVASAKFPNAESELEVQAEHMQVHQHPESILEVKRILLKNVDRSTSADSE
jgi:hypothetical protein